MDRLDRFYLKRYLQNPKRNLFRFSFVFMILGIMLSVGILSAGLNLFQGYETNLKRLLLDSFAHIGIQSSYKELITDQQQEMVSERLSQREEIISITPCLESALMAQNGDQVRAISLRAYDFSAGFPYARYISDGEIPLDDKEVIVGHYLAEELGLNIGDEILLNYPRLDRITPLGIHTSQASFRIAALYRSGFYESDRSLVISKIADARTLLMIPSGYSKIEIRLQDADQAASLSREFINVLGPELINIPWNLYAESLLHLVSIEKWLIFIVFSFLVLIAGINVISAVTTIIIDRNTEIAVLKSLGATAGVIKRLFAYRVGIVALLAVILGQILGAIMSWAVEKQSFYRLKGEVYFIDTLGAEITFFNLFVVFLVASVLIFLCIVLPLKQIERMQVIDILRHKK